MNVQCHRKLCELGRSEIQCILSCKTDFWYIFSLFRRESRRRFTAIALAIGRDLRSGAREN